MSEITVGKEPAHWLITVTRVYFIGGTVAIGLLGMFVMSPVTANGLFVQFLMFGLGLAATAWGVTAKSVPGTIVAVIGGVWMALIAALFTLT